MYNSDIITQLIEYISARDGINDKKALEREVQQKFNLAKDRSIFYGKWFAIRFSISKTANFSNTVASLSKLRKYDNIPFIACLVTPQRNYLMLANTTFLKKISHSSQELRCDNIKGSFNGSDIIKNFEGTPNIPQNFEYLFSMHENFTFEENLVRLVEATNNISPIGKKFNPTPAEINCIIDSVNRANSFLASSEYKALNEDLCNRVNAVRNEIAIASSIDNVNLRGRVIEYLITANDSLKNVLMDCLRNGKPLPEIFTADDLGDYEQTLGRYLIKTDIKTKVLYRSSCPKGYNIDKLLSFLAKENSVYLVFVVAIDQNKNIETCLCSLYSKQLLSGTRIIKHWAGRNSRGVTQYDGRSLENIIEQFDNTIDNNSAQEFLTRCLNS